MVEGMAPGTVTIRTFDLDEDQISSHSTRSLSGWVTGEDRGNRQGRRGLGLSLLRPELFQVQLRALLRAARYGNLRILFPYS